jgi:hypothetical protein
VIYEWFSGALFLISSFFSPSFLKREKIYSFSEKSLYQVVNLMERTCLTLAHFEILTKIFQSPDLQKSLDPRYDSLKNEQAQILKNFNLRLGHEISEVSEDSHIFWTLKTDIQPALSQMANDPKFQNLDLEIKACTLSIVEKAHQNLPQKIFFNKKEALKWNQIALGEYPQQYCLSKFLPSYCSQEKLWEISVTWTAIDGLLQKAFHLKRCPTLIGFIAQGLDVFRNVFHAMALDPLNSLLKTVANAKNSWVLKTVFIKGYADYALERLFYEGVFELMSNIWHQGAFDGIMKTGSVIGFLTGKSALNTLVWLTKQNLFLDTGITLVTGSLQWYWFGPSFLLAAESLRVIKRWVAEHGGQKKSKQNKILKEKMLWEEILVSSKISDAKIEKPYEVQKTSKEKDEKHENIFPKLPKREDAFDANSPKPSKICRSQTDSRDTFFLSFGSCRQRMDNQQF